LAGPVVIEATTEGLSGTTARMGLWISVTSLVMIATPATLVIAATAPLNACCLSLISSLTYILGMHSDLKGQKYKYSYQQFVYKHRKMERKVK